NAPTAWQWTFQGGTPTSSSDQNPFVCFPNGGNFTITLLASNAGGSDSATFIVNVTNAPPTPTITISSDSLKATIDTSYYTYQWYRDSTLLPNETNSYYIFSTGGNYNLRVTNSAGCSAAAGINVTAIDAIIRGQSTLGLTPNPVRDELFINTSWLN